MARLFVIPILLALLPEGILAFAMVAGIVWLGSVIYGFILMFGAALLMALPLLGDLVVDMDAPPQQVSVRVGWWGRVAFRGGDQAELRIRLLGIPYRRRIAKKPAKPKREEKKEPALSVKRWAVANTNNLGRLLFAVLQAVHEFVWESKAVAVTANGPTQIDVVDQLIAGVLGHRIIGPVDIEARPEGERKAHVTYRIGLAEALFIGMFVMLQGRPLSLMRSYQQAQKRAEATRVEVAGPRLVAPTAGVAQQPRPRPPEEEERRAA